MNDASLPDDLRKKLNAEPEQFNAQTTQMLIDKSADCVRRNASADQMAEELLSVFNTAAQNAAEINLPENAPIVRDTKYLDESGHVDYPKYAPDNGFVAGTKHIETLDADVLIDRYGGPGGGIQYKFPAPIEKLLNEYWEEVTQ